MPKAKTIATLRAKKDAPRIKPVARTSISDDIVSQILAMVTSGALKAGERLPSERELCLQFGAGRSSLREALRCLCILGVLRARAGEGTIVDLDGGRFFGKLVAWRFITEQADIYEMMELRIALEGTTAASAASHRTASHLTQLRRLMEQMADAVERRAHFAALDLQFHLLLAEISDNSLIRNLISTIRRQLEDTVARALELTNARPLSLREHEVIVRAIERGDAEAARRAMNDHLQAAMVRHRTAVAKVG